MQTTRVTGCFAIDVVDINEVNVTGYVELTRAEFAHADDPQGGLHGLWGRPLGRLDDGGTVNFFQGGYGVRHGLVQCELSQVGGGQCDIADRCLARAIKGGKALNDQLSQDTQAAAEVIALLGQRVAGLRHVSQRGNARCQQWQLLGVASADALNKPGMCDQVGAGGLVIKTSHAVVGISGGRGHN